MLQTLLAEWKTELAHKAPALARQLKPGASMEQIAAAEATLGCPFPAELVALYTTYNGQEDGPGLLGDWPLSSLDELCEEWQNWQSLDSFYQDSFSVAALSLPRGFVRELYSSPQWLPIAKDFGGNNLAVDIGPDSRGQVGQVIVFGRDFEHKQVLANSLTDLFADLLRQLKESDDVLSEDGECLLELPRVKPPGAKEITPSERARWEQGLSAGWRAALAPVLKRLSSGTAWEEVVSLTLLRAEITDLGPLAVLGELRELVVSASPLRSLAGIAACPHLKKLILGNNRQLEISALAGCQQLQSLSLSSSPVPSLAPVWGLRQLRQLNLEGTGLQTLSGVEHLNALQELNLSRTSVTDLTPLQALPKLVELKLADTPVTDLSPLRSLPGLRALDLSALETRDYSPLADLPALMHLTCSYAQFEQLRPWLSAQPNIAIAGEMSETQRAIWRAYLADRT